MEKEYDGGSSNSNETEDGAAACIISPRPNLMGVSRAPISCPFSQCKRSMGVSMVMSHYLTDHCEDVNIECKEVLAGKPIYLMINPGNLIHNEIVGMGLLAYAGPSEKMEARPAVRGISIANSFLPQSQSNFESHLPIVILICKTSFGIYFKDKSVAEQLNDPNNLDQQLLVIWLASPQTTSPIYATITVYDKRMSASRSTIVRVRSLADSQDPNEIAKSSTDFLKLGRGDIEVLTRDGSLMNLEIVVNEYN